MVSKTPPLLDSWGFPAPTLGGTGNSGDKHSSLRRLKLGLSFGLFAASAVAGSVCFLLAADVTNRRDQMSNMAASAYSTHAVSFSLKADKRFEYGKSAAVRFPSGFAIESGNTWVAADFSFSDGTARPVVDVDQGPGVTTVSCSTANPDDVGVAVDTTAREFRVSPCNATFSASALGAAVTFTINAGLPGGSMLNPTTPGTYLLEVRDASGDCTSGGVDCQIAVSILNVANVSVTARVGPCSNGVLDVGEQCDDGNLTDNDGCTSECLSEGGGGGGEEGCTMILDNITVGNVGASSATVSWITNAPGDSLVRYGLTSAYGQSTTGSSSTSSHAVNLVGLTEGATFHYQVCSESGTCAQACSTDRTFATVDESLPGISNVQCAATQTLASVTWTTDEVATSFVDYGLGEASYSSIEGATNPRVTSHSVGLSGLTPQTSYHYRVRSADAAGNEAVSPDAVCTTTGGQCIECSRLSYDFFIVNPDGAERHVGTSWVHQTDLGGGNKRYSFEDTSIASGDFDDVVVEVNTQSCLAVSVVYVANNAATTHSLRVKVKVDGAEQANTLLSDDTLAAVGGSLTVNAADLAAGACAAPPVITNIKVVGVTSDEATVSWNTNKDASTWLDYGTAAGPPYDETVGEAAPLSTEHTVDISGLAADTPYHFRPRSAGADGLEAQAGDRTFRTSDGVPPVITNLRAISVSDSTASITWDTDIAADSTVLYGITTSYGFTQLSADMVTGGHVVDIVGLTPNVTYNFQARSADAEGDTAISSNFTFTTALPAPPAISGISVTSLTPTGARVNWTTSTASDSRVEYGLTSGNLNLSQSLSGASTAHAVNLTGLAQGTTYYYRVVSKDAYNQTGTSSTLSFQTTDATAPGNVTGFTATPSDGRIALAWVMPGDDDLAGVRIVRKTTGFPQNPSDGSAVFLGLGTSYLDANVSGGTTYFYAVFSFDEVPNYSSGATASAATPGADATAPADVTSFAATPGNGQITLTWVNPAAADFQGTLIVRKTGSCPTSRTDGTSVYNQSSTSYLNVGLANGTLYCYRAYAHDGVPNYAGGVNAQATPTVAADTEAPGPVTNLAAAPGDAQALLTWTNPSDADYAKTRLLRKAGGYSTGPEDGTIVFDGAGDNHLETGLLNGALYYYTAYAYDGAGNYSTPAQVQVMPDQEAITPTLACTDSDGGLNYFVKGTVTIADGDPETDACVGGEVKEFVCDGIQAGFETRPCDGGFRCSDGRCVSNEYVPAPSQCGNGLCDASENALGCPADCPAQVAAPQRQVPESTVSSELRLQPSDIEYFATSAMTRLRVLWRSPQQVERALALVADAEAASTEATVQSYGGMTVTVLVAAGALPKEVQSAYVNLGGSSYPTQVTGAGIRSTVSTPTEPGLHPLVLVMNYADGTVDTVTVYVDTVARPTVTGGAAGEADQPLAGARVSLFAEQGGSYGLYDGTASGQPNPVTTDQDGGFSFVLPPGRYFMRVEAEGHATRETSPFLMDTDNVVTGGLRLLKLPPTIAEALQTEGDTTTKALAVVDAIAQQAGFAALTAVDRVIDAATSPVVQEQARTVVAPTVTAVAVVNVVTAASALPYLNYVLSLMAHPILLIARRKRKKWGVVYDALSKLPVDLAIVRLTDAATGRILRSAVTDRDGRYFFIVGKGSYRLSVAKAGHVFPTQHLRGAKEDAEYVDLYHGEVIEAREETSLTANIPLDPTREEKKPWRITAEAAARRLQKALGIVTLVVMIAAFAINPTVAMGALLAFNILFYWLFSRLAMPRRPKGWGIVRDERSSRPLSNVVVRIFETKFNKLLETQVTDIRGRYAFLVGSNIYYVTYEKPGYQKQQKGPVDFVKAPAGKRGEPRVVAVDVRLKKEKGITSPTPSVPAAKTTPPSSLQPPETANEKTDVIPQALPKQSIIGQVGQPVVAEGVAKTVVDIKPGQSTSMTPPKKLWELDLIRKLSKKSLNKAGETPPQAPASPQDGQQDAHG